MHRLSKETLQKSVRVMQIWRSSNHRRQPQSAYVRFSLRAADHVITVCDESYAVHAGAEDVQERLLQELHSTTDTAMDVTVIDQGSFAFMEFEDGQDAPQDGPVISGVQALQILPSTLACRAVHFPAIDATQQVGCHACRLNAESQCQEQLGKLGSYWL